MRRVADASEEESPPARNYNRPSSAASREVELSEVVDAGSEDLGEVSQEQVTMHDIDLHDLGHQDLMDDSKTRITRRSISYGSQTVTSRTSFNSTEGQARGDGSSFMDEGCVCTSNAERFALVDRAFDEMGAGRFHVLLFLSAAVGFMVEAAEMNMLGLLLPKFEQVWGVEDEDLSVIASFTGIGMIIGVLIFGRLSDIIGRKKVFHMCLTGCVIFGFLSSYTNSVMSFATMRLFLGLAYGGNTVSAATLLIESVPTAWRGFFSAMVSFAFTFGYILVVLLAWAVMEPWGWQWLVRLVALMGIPAVFLLNFVPESVRFCVLRKDYHQCVFVIERIAYHNRVPVPPYFTYERLAGTSAPAENNNTRLHQARASTSSEASIKLLDERFSFRKTFRTFAKIARTPPLIPLMCLWFLNSFGQNIVIFLPLELKKRFPDVKDSTYKVSLALSIGAFIGSCVVLFLSSRVRRKTELRLGLAIMGTMVLIITHLHSAFGLVILFLMFEHIGMSIIYHGLYTYTPEVFSTAVRVTCFSVCQTCHRLAPVVAPFLVANLAEQSFALLGTVFSGIFFFAFLLASFGLKKETFGTTLVEETGDADDLDPFQPSGFNSLERRGSIGSLSETESSKLSDFQLAPNYASDDSAKTPPDTSVVVEA